MGWSIEKTQRIWKPYDWEVFFSSHGLWMGTAWTRRGAERKLFRAQSIMLSEER